MGTNCYLKTVLYPTLGRKNATKGEVTGWEIGEEKNIDEKGKIEKNIVISNCCQQNRTCYFNYFH